MCLAQYKIIDSAELLIHDGSFIRINQTIRCGTILIFIEGAIFKNSLSQVREIEGYCII